MTQSQSQATAAGMRGELTEFRIRLLAILERHPTMKYRDIATQLGCPVGSVQGAIFALRLAGYDIPKRYQS